MRHPLRRVRPALLGCLAAATLAAAWPASVVAGTADAGHDPAHTEVLFVGAHPDDEYQSLSTFGQWAERRGLSTGVVTITRGEGGGNAVGPEEGAELGMLREREEREAVALAGIQNVYYLDKPDFWYSLSAPLTARVWDGQTPARDTLSRLVRLIRATTPEIVVAMDPRPFNQHGGHQLSGQLAIQAFQLAGDRNAFPAQITEEKYAPHQPSRLLAQNWGFQGPVGRACAKSPQRDPATGLPVRGWWSGAWSSRHGSTWAQVERDAQRKYLSQGFGAVPPDVETPRGELGCDWFTVLAQHGKPVRAPVEPQSGLRPLYAKFARWARDVGMPWLANAAQPNYPEPPRARVPEASVAPVVDGKARDGEYPGGTLRLTHWEGKGCKNSADCAAEAKLSRFGDALYALVRVRDDVRGTALSGDDCKRHWRTDSVEVGLDPGGASDDTSTVFKVGVLPFTEAGGPCAGRDADHWQGPVAQTAAGMQVASAVTQEPYTGYTVEVKIPLRALPSTADPKRLTVNVMAYDSDTQDKTGQTRLAWSPFGSAQADPYVWGRAELEGGDAPHVPTREPRIPTEAARSINSPASVAQSQRTGVPLAGGPRT
ncbi:sugar-binding protein [Streptomyces sp. WMMC897]|uniref:sugar-binding protein n=1 Tax=Streptomyces sp. WMMC897 TaxID=3014782 RepID=UPI0022B6EFED|nr:sugar-binding protein [Streptomyces sp. WMMC897]MCZ7416830.1 PIG-L family deacetylase [Streptomyces sp. WMMC897]